jgi:2-dehydro-3-deoxygalactonokinase
MGKAVAIDWGTSSFRGYLLGKDGRIIEKIRDDCGILRVPDGDFDSVLDQQLNRFTGALGDPTILCSGMITSKNGWLETPYVTCPAGIEELAANLKQLESRQRGKIYFVPGVCQYKPHTDVMRGEESQLAGLEIKGKQLVILPGSHSKWVELSDGRIQRFFTCLTGELFEAVSNHTILRFLPQLANDQEQFLRGVRHGYQQRGAGLFSTLFQMRARMLLTEEAEGRDYLSGLFLGTEIGEGMDGGFRPDGEIVILGREELTVLYQLALAELGLSSRLKDEDIVAKGLFQIVKKMEEY